MSSFIKFELEYSIDQLNNSVKGLNKLNGGMNDDEMKEFISKYLNYEVETLTEEWEYLSGKLETINDQTSDEYTELESRIEEIVAKATESTNKWKSLKYDIERNTLETYMKEYLETPRGKSLNKLPANSVYIRTDKTRDKNFGIIQFSKRLINHMKKLLKLPYEVSGRLDFGLKYEFQRGTFRFLSDTDEIKYNKDASGQSPLELSDDYELFFHTHPSQRIENNSDIKFEPPSQPDIVETIRSQFTSYIQKSETLFQQHLVITPEGIYTLMLTKNKLESMLKEIQEEYDSFKLYITNFNNRMDKIFHEKNGMSFKEATEKYNSTRIYDNEADFFLMLQEFGANIKEDGEFWWYELVGSYLEHPGHFVHFYDYRYFPNDKFIHPLMISDLQIAQRAFNKIISNISMNVLYYLYEGMDKEYVDLTHQLVFEGKINIEQYKEDIKKLQLIKTKDMNDDDREEYINKTNKKMNILSNKDTYDHYIKTIKKLGVFISLQKWNYQDLKETPNIRFKIIPIEDYDYDSNNFDIKKVDVKKFVRL